MTSAEKFEQACKKFDQACRESQAADDELNRLNDMRIFGYSLEEIAEKLARLQSFENVGEALWPFVRAFGLCGAHPSAIAAVVALGKLLGHSEASQSTVLEIADKVRAEVVDELAAKLEELLRGKVLSRELPNIIDEIRKL